MNPGVGYEYTVPAGFNYSRLPEFAWKYSDWTACTKTCGGGTKVGVLTGEARIKGGQISGPSLSSRLAYFNDVVVFLCNLGDS